MIVDPSFVESTEVVVVDSSEDTTPKKEYSQSEYSEANSSIRKPADLNFDNFRFKETPATPIASSKQSVTSKVI